MVMSLSGMSVVPSGQVNKLHVRLQQLSMEGYLEVVSLSERSTMLPGHWNSVGVLQVLRCAQSVFSQQVSTLGMSLPAPVHPFPSVMQQKPFLMSDQPAAWLLRPALQSKLLGL